MTKAKIRLRIQRLQHNDIFSRSAKRRFTEAKRQAGLRGIRWAIPFSEYQKLVELPCVYCQQQKHETGCGLDRIDNAKGYTLDNVQPACWVCNVMRNDLPVEFFLEVVRRIQRTLNK